MESARRAGYRGHGETRQAGCGAAVRRGHRAAGDELERSAWHRQRSGGTSSRLGSCLELLAGQVAQTPGIEAALAWSGRTTRDA